MFSSKLLLLVYPIYFDILSLFSLISKCFLMCLWSFSLSHCLFWREFNFHILVILPNNFLLFISNFIPLWSDGILCIISILSSLLKLVLWSVRSVLEKVAWAFKKNVYFGGVGSSVLHMSLKSSWFMVFIQDFYFPGIIYLTIYFWMWVLKIATVTIDLSISFFTSVFTSFLGELCFKVIYVYNCCIFLMNCPFYHYKIPLLKSRNIFVLISILFVLL